MHNWQEPCPTCDGVKCKQSARCRRCFANRAEERFWAKVDKDADDGCWAWRASVTGPGYGQFGVAAGKIVLAHRHSYELIIGSVPNGLQLDHLCSNRACVNPAHLEPVTRAENLRRGEGFTGVNSRKAECIHGHLLSGSNLYLDPRGRRQCRQCRAATQRKRRAAHA